MLPSPLLLPARTVSGAGTWLKLAGETAAFGSRGVIVHGSAVARPKQMQALLASFPAGTSVSAIRHAGNEPTVQEVEGLRQALREARPDWVAAIGGGSVIDLAKAAAGLIDAPGSVASYQTGAPIPAGRLPFVAVPTTAGTGSEATVVSVLTDAATGLKQSIRHASHLPALVILDPTLLHGCPKPVVAAAGMDALTQAFESLTSRYATPFTRALSEMSLAAIVQALPAFHGGETEAAEQLLQGSFLAGVALSHARLGVVHGLAHPLGSRWHAPHGLVCAVCLPAAIRFNQPVLGAALGRVEERLGVGIEACVTDFLRRFRLASPFAGQPIRDRDAIVRETLASGSTAANPRPVTPQDVHALLDEIFAPA